jgi:hypothetical protein
MNKRRTMPVRLFSCHAKGSAGMRLAFEWPTRAFRCERNAVAPGLSATQSNRQPVTLYAAYAAARISLKLNGRTNKFGWLQAPATKKFLPFNNFCKPRNHPN